MNGRAAWSLLEGAIDLHVHPAPSRRPRHSDAWDLAERAAAAGMAGLLLKDHDRPTFGDAAVVSAHGPGPTAFASVCCNAAIGGVNVHAVEAAIDLGVAMIFLPTVSARNDRDVNGYEPDDDALVAADAGALAGNVQAVLRMAADAGVPVATGHLSRDEVSAVVAAGAALGTTVVVTHAPVFTRCGLDDLVAWSRAGALIELAAAFCCGGAHLSSHLRRTLDDDAAVIEAVGADSIVLSSDLGFAGGPTPVEGFADYLDGLRATGVEDSVLRRATCDTPRRVLATALGAVDS